MVETIETEHGNFYKEKEVNILDITVTKTAKHSEHITY
jgi:hypothetical protein